MTTQCSCWLFCSPWIHLMLLATFEALHCQALTASAEAAPSWQRSASGFQKTGEFRRTLHSWTSWCGSFLKILWFSSARREWNSGRTI
uniref:Putative secreted protein n=1 Tax=Ixodes ricinus TaxID=34613 RepID=A0A6B0UAR3_IXORI